jgi:hypothetical protein
MPLPPTRYESRAGISGNIMKAKLIYNTGQ